MTLCNQTIRNFALSGVSEEYTKMKKEVGNSILFMKDLKGVCTSESGLLTAEPMNWQHRDGTKDCSDKGTGCTSVGTSKSSTVTHEYYACLNYEPSEFETKYGGTHESAKLYLEAYLGNLIKNELIRLKIQQIIMALSATIGSKSNGIVVEDTAFSAKTPLVMANKFGIKRDILRGTLVDSHIYSALIEGQADDKCCIIADNILRGGKVLSGGKQLWETEVAEIADKAFSLVQAGVMMTEIQDMRIKIDEVNGKNGTCYKTHIYGAHEIAVKGYSFDPAKAANASATEIAVIGNWTKTAKHDYDLAGVSFLKK